MIRPGAPDCAPVCRPPPRFTSLLIVDWPSEFSLDAVVHSLGRSRQPDRFVRSATSCIERGNPLVRSGVLRPAALATRGGGGTSTLNQHREAGDLPLMNKVSLQGDERRHCGKVGTMCDTRP